MSRRKHKKHTHEDIKLLKLLCIKLHAYCQFSMKEKLENSETEIKTQLFGK